MTEGVVEPLEEVQIAEQQRHRLAARTTALQQGLPGIDERASVADAGERIAERGVPILLLGTLANHRQGDEGNADGIEQRLEDHEGKKLT